VPRSPPLKHTTGLTRGFYHLLTAEDQICGNVVVTNEKMSSLILLLVRLVFRRYE